MTSFVQKKSSANLPAQRLSESGSGQHHSTQIEKTNIDPISEPVLNRKLNQSPRVQNQYQLYQSLNQGAHQVAQAKLVQSLGGRQSGKGVVQRVGNGLAEPELIAVYTRPLLKGFIDNTPPTRFEMLMESINITLAKAGIPTIEGEPTDVEGYAEFDPETWKMKIPKSLLETRDPKIASELVGTVYHEARHAEQYFRVAQQYATEEKEIELFTLKLPGEVREAAVKSKAQLKFASGTMIENIKEWTQSLKKPEEVLKQGSLAEFELAKQVEVFKSAVNALLSTAQEIPLALELNKLNEVDIEPVLTLIKGYRQEQSNLTKVQKLAYLTTLEYRRMPHEQDAHILGWTVEDTFRTGELQKTYDPKYENRVPKTDKIWKALEIVDLGVKELENLALRIQEATKPQVKVEEDEEDFSYLLETTPEEDAQQMAIYQTKQSSGPIYEKAYSEALEYYKKKKSEEESQKKDATPLSKETVLEQLFMINGALSFWYGAEDEYLKALSALLHRRTNI